MKKLFILFIISTILVSCGEPEDYLVVIKTKYGDMKLVLFDETPQHKNNFIKLAKEGSYDSTIFHRVIENFMIQGGDVNRKKGAEGSVDYTVPAEIQEEITGKFFHTKGALAAARLGDSQNPEKESSGCQFYIVDGASFDALNTDQNKLNEYFFRRLLSIPEYSYLNDTLRAISSRGGGNAEYFQCALDNKKLVENVLEVDLSNNILSEAQREAYSKSNGGAPHLDGGYTVYGRVVEGMEVIDKIAAIKTNRERPVENIGMKVELIPISKKQLRKQYKEYFPEPSK